MISRLKERIKTMELERKQDMSRKNFPVIAGHFSEGYSKTRAVHPQARYFK
jgi:hypothetical protein